MTTHKQVAQAWIMGWPAKGSNMHTDGETIWSFGWHVIGWTRYYSSAKTLWDIVEEKVAVDCGESLSEQANHIEHLLPIAEKIVSKHKKAGWYGHTKIG
tara:strand:- start:95 stop:391 length:297 start_codon:yes stop_codon:yes gene_type:complete